MSAPTVIDQGGLAGPARAERAAISRRKFLQGAGALIVSFSMDAGLLASAAQFDGGEAGPVRNQVDSWIAIHSDGSLTAFTGKEELGQGISTAQMQLVAEELCVPIERVLLIYGDTAVTPDQGVTSGSQSHPANFNHANLAQAAATARQALVQLGSRQLGVPVDQLTARDGCVCVKGDEIKKIGYGELIGKKKFELRIDPQAPRKVASEWTVLGTPAQRPDLPDLVTGKFEFVHNLRLAGMLHGRVVRPPAVGSTVLHVDESSVAGIPGVVKVVVKNNFVGVVAHKPWQAMQAARKLAVTWSAGTGLPNHEQLYDFVRHNSPVRDTLLVDSKDVEQAVGSAATLLKATYHYPYQMHGSMGASCAVADVQGEKATIYSPTQAVWHQRSTCAMVLGLKPENIRVIFRRASGCYGCNGADAVTYDAALLSQAAGQPVKVQLTRQDEMAWAENYGFAYVIDERAGLDAEGNIVAWDHESWSPVLGNRPGTSAPGNVVSGMLAGFSPEPFLARSPAPPPNAYNNNSNGVPSYFAGQVRGAAKGTGTIKSERSLIHNSPGPFFTGPLRSPSRLQNTFAQECFMDEMAARVKTDPVAFRLKHLSDPRLSDVLKAVAEKSHWNARAASHAQSHKSATLLG